MFPMTKLWTHVSTVSIRVVLLFADRDYTATGLARGFEPACTLTRPLPRHGDTPSDRQESCGCAEWRSRSASTCTGGSAQLHPGRFRHPDPLSVRCSACRRTRFIQESSPPFALCVNCGGLFRANCKIGSTLWWRWAANALFCRDCRFHVMPKPTTTTPHDRWPWGAR